jgi:hypothetical protein
MRAGRRLRRLERAAFRRWVEMMTDQERVYYMRLLRRIERDGFDSLEPAHLERAVAFLRLASGELPPA